MSMNPEQVNEVLRIAAVQMVSGPDIDENLAVAGELLAQAADQGARLVGLPEYFPLLSPDETEKVRVREAYGQGRIQDFLADAARRHRLWIVGGTLPLEADVADKVRNSTLVFDDRGERVARYDKIHLFGFAHESERYDEARTIEAGADVAVFDSPVGRIGLSVCYDLRFPELFREMGAVDLIMVPSAFTHTTGSAHWEVLLRARAIENQCYVMAPAQGGLHPGGRVTWGHTMIVDPWGTVIACQDEGPGVIVADIDRTRIASIREGLPALKHRRLQMN